MLLQASYLTPGSRWAIFIKLGMHFGDLYIDWPCNFLLQLVDPYCTQCTQDQATDHGDHQHHWHHHWGDKTQASISWQEEQESKGELQGVRLPDTWLWLSRMVDGVINTNDEHLQHCNAPHLNKMVVEHQTHMLLDPFSPTTGAKRRAYQKIKKWKQLTDPLLIGLIMASTIASEQIPTFAHHYTDTSASMLTRMDTSRLKSSQGPTWISFDKYWLRNFEDF